MRFLITGVAGFIGSQLAAELLTRGHEVLGVDCITDAYSTRLKELNVEGLKGQKGFQFLKGDLLHIELDELVNGCDAAFHLAAIPGVRASWEYGFREYVENNILATQHLLEAVRRTTGPRVVYASSSSVYGNAVRYPSVETDLRRPFSPYGVTKLSAEQLCLTYADVFGMEVVGLRYFSVYGPRQRPDMGVHRIIEAARTGSTFTIYGNGDQVRDMTYVGDVIEATILAAGGAVPSRSVANVAGGSNVSLNELISMVGAIAGCQVHTNRIEAQAGDVTRTGGDTSRARAVLGWEPRVSLEEGLRRQIEWHWDLRPGDLG